MSKLAVSYSTKTGPSRIFPRRNGMGLSSVVFFTWDQGSWFTMILDSQPNSTLGSNFFHQTRLPGFAPSGSKHWRGDVVQFRGFFLKLKLTRKIILYFRTSKSLWWWRSLANELVLVNLSWTWIIVLVRIQSQYISKSGTLFVYLDHPLLFT